MRILFSGTPEIAVPALEFLHARYPVAAVLCSQDAKVGRKGVLTAPPVKICAQKLEISIFQPGKIDDDFTREIQLLRPDLLVCFAYGKIFPKEFLSLFPLGAINLHPSLLPLWRGPSPIQATLMAGEKITGISVQHMAAKMDAGPVIIQEKIQIEEEETARSLSCKVAQMAGPLLQKTIALIQEGNAAGTPQEHDKATYCRLITKETAHLNCENSAYQLECLVRAMYDSPGAQAVWQGKNLRVLKAKALEDFPQSARQKPGDVFACDKSQGILVQTGKGVLALRELQLAGKKCLNYKEFINGNGHIVGSRLE